MSRRSGGQVLVGALLVLAGVVLLLDRLDVLRASNVWSVLVPTAVVAVGAAALALVPRAWFGPVIVIAAGGLWLLDALDVVRESPWTFALPVAVAVLGLSILLASTAGGDDADRVRLFVFFWGGDRRSLSQQFRSASLTAVFGGIDLDLRAAAVQGRARVDIFTMFGGVEIKVPPTWRVQMVTLPVFGGTDDKTVAPLAPDAPVLDVHAVTIFGGATLKHGKPLAQQPFDAAAQPPYGTPGVPPSDRPGQPYA